VPYCTKDDLLRRFGPNELRQVSDRTQAADINDAFVADACDEATSLIDSYISERYTTPLTIVPTVVRKWACDIARYILRGDTVQRDSTVDRNYRDALTSLSNVAKGLVGLPDATGVDASDVGKAGIVVQGPGVVFTDELMGFMP
jgi:phage gp36-like protein